MTRLGVAVGLWAENEVDGRGTSVWQKDALFCGSLYSARTTGFVGSEMSIIRAQPHGHPCAPRAFAASP
jgi:hypothetical protein